MNLRAGGSTAAKSRYTFTGKHRLKYERESFKPSTIDDRTESLCLEELTYLYLKSRQFDKKKLQNFLYQTKDLLSEYGAVQISDITTAELSKMLATLSAKQIKQNTIRRRFAMIKAVLYWGYKNGYLEKMPPLPAVSAGRDQKIVPPSQEEVAALFHVAQPHIQRVIVLGYYVGMRVGTSEMFRLWWEDVDFFNHLIRVPNADKGATAQWRDVPINDSIYSLLKRWRNEDGDIEYVVHYKGQPVSSVKKAWVLCLKKAGITRKIRPYDLKHGFATTLIAGGTDIGTVAALMGHTSPTMVLTYYQHVLTSQKKEAVSKLPDFKAFKKGVLVKMPEKSNPENRIESGGEEEI